MTLPVNRDKLIAKGRGRGQGLISKYAITEVCVCVKQLLISRHAHFYVL